MKKDISYIIIIALNIISLFLGCLIGKTFERWVDLKRRDLIECIEKTDTLYIRDTVNVLKPMKTTEKTIDTVYLNVADTIRINDTIYFSLPRIERSYLSELYSIRVSGIDPVLESVEVYPETKIVTQYVPINHKKKRWGVGLQAGFGAGVAGKNVVLTPYIGIGISYNLFVW